ncbi:hypothetical protein WISP_146855 [Willisornis vidua]|uniref:Uncharacterized protein n=1 Tax=Willisornis vidua TaxID=1566151 RepID=A0ABQ9CQ75_9PASS|nr:hypothetical protein WISP_146855 [Willisornis vidua]
MSGVDKNMLIRTEDTTMRGEVYMLKGGAAIHRDLDGLEDKANRNFITFKMYEQEKSQAVKRSGYLPPIKAL